MKAYMNYKELLNSRHSEATCCRENPVKKKVGFTNLVKHFRSNRLTAMLRSRLSRFSLTKCRSIAAHSYGFTLAEVLTTLVVIGIVAMMVVPNLIDSSNEKVNEMAAKKAKLDVAQAAMKVQAQCPRGHGCTDDTINNIFKESLPNKGDTKFKAKKTDGVVTDIIVDVDSDDYVDLHYTIDIGNATVTDDTDCSIDKYLTNTSCAAKDNGFTTTTKDKNNKDVTTKNKFSEISDYAEL